MTILVTGATGNVGHHVVKQLVAAGQRVRALTRNPAAKLPEHVEVIAGDLTKTDTLAGAFDGVTAVHLISFGGDSFSPLNNAPEIISLAQRAGVRRVTVLVGSYEKGPVEQAVEDSDLQWTHLAPVEFMANSLEWAESIRAEGVVREAFGQVKSAVIHEADIAAVAVSALTADGHAGKIYALTGPEALTPSERVRKISEAIGREVKFVDVSVDGQIAQWRESGYTDEDIAYFMEMRTNPPVEGYTVLPTVEQVTGRPARTFAQWAVEHRDTFRP